MLTFFSSIAHSARDLKMKSKKRNPNPYLPSTKSVKSKEKKKSSKTKKQTCKTIYDFDNDTFSGYDVNHRYYDVTLGPGNFYNQNSSGENYLVGPFDKIIGNTAFYSGGDSRFCGKSREGSVELIEDSTIQYGTQVSFYEPEKCVYKAVIAVPKVCDH